MSRSRSRLRVLWAFLAVFVAHFLFTGLDAVGQNMSKAHIYGEPPAPFIVADWPVWKKLAVIMGYPGSYILRHDAASIGDGVLVAVATSLLWAIVLVGTWCPVRRAIRSGSTAAPDPP